MEASQLRKTSGVKIPLQSENSTPRIQMRQRYGCEHVSVKRQNSHFSTMLLFTMPVQQIQMNGGTSEPPHIPCTPERDLAGLKWWIQQAQAACCICSAHCATGSRAHSPYATQLCRFGLVTEISSRSETCAGWVCIPMHLKFQTRPAVTDHCSH